MVSTLQRKPRLGSGMGQNGQLLLLFFSGEMSCDIVSNVRIEPPTMLCCPGVVPLSSVGVD